MTNGEESKRSMGRKVVALKSETHKELAAMKRSMHNPPYRPTISDVIDHVWSFYKAKNAKWNSAKTTNGNTPL